MNTPSPSESNPPAQTSTDRELSLEMLQEQHLNLKVSVEELYARVNQIRGLLQTLVMGLAIAILLAIGISGWFAYRLLVQEQIMRRDTEQAAATNAKILEQLEQVETQLQRQKDQIQTFREEVPDEFKTLTDTVQANQRQLQILRDRIKQIEPKLSPSNRTQ
ncbi:hypothetical protein IQ270_11285 [Microcoleus sp. LEGE 07076]|uniref:hypothetical protein n=1 Tax=Microcoleus sp. LEGE 07076 TaxID=915322 RepID=UPI00187F47C4|nr:hypothetical protein [Microcoleus sp. LEGE 07076]MBE9185280.1 hypothetical protein [Microcoleus sp. LEGE 07076]